MGLPLGLRTTCKTQRGGGTGRMASGAPHVHLCLRRLMMHTGPLHPVTVTHVQWTPHPGGYCSIPIRRQPQADTSSVPPRPFHHSARQAFLAVRLRGNPWAPYHGPAHDSSPAGRWVPTSSAMPCQILCQQLKCSVSLTQLRGPANPCLEHVCT